MRWPSTWCATPASRSPSSSPPIATSRATPPTRSSSRTIRCPVVVDPEAAMEGKPGVIHKDFPNNLAVALVPSGTGVAPDFSKIDNTAVDKAFADAEVVISQRMVNHRLVPNAMEPRGVLAHWEPGKETMTIWSSTQNPHILKTMIAAMNGLGQHQVRAIAPEVGGGFGAKINIYAEEYVCSVVSKKLGMPIKWIEDRSEAFVATTHGRDIIGYIDVAARKDGKVLGLKMRLIADIGAYNMLLTAAIPTLTMLMANGTYDIPAIRTTLTEVFTNKTPTDAYRGAGRPEATYFVERAMDMLARELNMDPAELRRKNFIKSNQFPYQTQMGAVYDSGDYEKALDAALKASNWKGLIAERDQARKEGRLVGLGLAMYVEVCGLGPSSSLPTGGWEHGQVTIERDGRITATTGASPHGQGNETTFAQMLADQFSVPFEHVTILHGDTGIVKQGIGTFGSRSQAVAGTALHLAGAKVKKKMAQFAAAMLEASEDDIVFENGTIGVKGAPAKAKTVRRDRGVRVRAGAAAGGHGAGSQRRSVLRAGQQHLSVRLSHLDARDRSRDRRADAAEADRGRRCRQPDQSADRRRTDPRRPRAGHRPGDDRRSGLQRRRPADDRIVHGLRDAAGQRLPALRAVGDRDADAVQSVRRQGRRRSRHARIDAVHRVGGGRRAEPVRREAHRHDAAARKAVANHQRLHVAREAAHDSGCIRLRTRHLDRRCDREARRVERRQGDRRRAQPGAADEAAAERARHAGGHLEDSRSLRHQGGRRPHRDRRDHDPHRHRDLEAVARQVPDDRGSGAEIGDPQVQESRHHRRQHRARRSGRGLSRRSCSRSTRTSS